MVILHKTREVMSFYATIIMSSKQVGVDFYHTNNMCSTYLINATYMVLINGFHYTFCLVQVTCVGPQVGVLLQHSLVTLFEI